MIINKHFGFTLIEVMISMFIMAALTVLVSTTIRTAVQNKRKLEAHIESETRLYDALRVMKMDIERAFNYQDVFFEIERLAIMQLDSEKNKNKGGNEDNESRLPPQKLTHFIGESASVHFTALNHFRTKYNAQESNQMEVGYFLDNCRSRKDDTSSQCLWRRASTLIDDNVEKDGTKVVLAENISQFKLSYRSNEENDEWQKSWRSDNKGRSEHRKKFPHLVKIDLAIGDDSNKKIKPVKQSIVVRVQFPNNEPLLSDSTPKAQGKTN